MGRAKGVLSLQTLSDRSGVAIPQGKRLALRTRRTNGPDWITVACSDRRVRPRWRCANRDGLGRQPGLVTAKVLTGNRSIRIDMQGYEDMVFELFEQRAPNASGRVIELAEADFYDNISFHRIVNNFVIQAGDPTGTGTSGSTLGNFDDDFHPELQHNRSGVLSFAKTTDDTNNSQFFITEVPTRHLDFNHSIFGQLVEGEEVARGDQQPSNQQFRTADASDQDRIDRRLQRLRELGGDAQADGQCNRIDECHVHRHGCGRQQLFRNGAGRHRRRQYQWQRPTVFERHTVPTSSPLNTPVNLQLSSTDVEGDAVTYFASLQSGNATAVVNPTTGLLTVTPATDFTGEVFVEAGVRPGPGVTGNASSDQDTIDLASILKPNKSTTPSSLDLLTGSDSGSSNIDNVTNLESLTFSVGGVSHGATVEITLVSTGAVLGIATASGVPRRSRPTISPHLATAVTKSQRVKERTVKRAAFRRPSPWFTTAKLLLRLSVPRRHEPITMWSTAAT